MKTTLDIPEETLDELLASGDFRSKKEAVNAAIEAYLRSKRIESLLRAAGKMDDFMGREELAKARSDG